MHLSLSAFSLLSEGRAMAEPVQNALIDNLIRIGIALSSERNIDVLLEMIVDESRRFTNADAGTLYTVSDEGNQLEFKIVQTESLDIRMGGTSQVKVDQFKPIPLVEDGQANLSNVSAHVANTGEAANIPDVYEAEDFDFTGPRRYDESTGYRSQSMLVVPLRDHEDDIIGVLQLMNAQDPEKSRVIPFSPSYEAMVSSLASQAAVGITNARLIHDLEALFDAFLQTIASAIEEKTAYTAGHVQRVAELTVAIADEISEEDTGIWEHIRFTEDELKELRLAAWMHDVGKITTPEYVVDKATKLETIHDRIETVKTRYEVLKKDARIVALEKKNEVLSAGNGDADALAEIDAELEGKLTELQDDLDYVVQCNTGGEYMEDESIARLESIARRACEVNGETSNSLTEDELANLCIRKGTLTDEERLVINNHVAVSSKMLSQLPFSKKLKRVPEFAGGHHEQLNGKGYPQGLSAEELPLQARIMAVADIFEAVTAPDRPYRKPNPLSKALGILGNAAKFGELDSRIVDLFVGNGVALKYAKRALRPEQIDVEEG